MASWPSDIHRLVHYPETQGLSETATGDAQVLVESCSDGLPFGWLFLFGSRNIWEPGQMVGDRGGAAAQRDPTVTPIDIAQVRLHEASGVLRNDPAFGLACAGLQLLERALDSAGERGQLRLQSPPGAFGEKTDPEEKRRRFLEQVAVAENIVFHLGQKNRIPAEQALNLLRAQCPFVPTGNAAQDWKDLQKAMKRVGGRIPPEEVVVRLLVGWPPGGRMKTLFAADAPPINRQFQEKAATTLPPKGKGAWWMFWKK